MLMTVIPNKTNSYTKAVLDCMLILQAKNFQTG